MRVALRIARWPHRPTAVDAVMVREKLTNVINDEDLRKHIL